MFVYNTYALKVSYVQNVVILPQVGRHKWFALDQMAAMQEKVLIIALHSITCCTFSHEVLSMSSFHGHVASLQT